MTDSPGDAAAVLVTIVGPRRRADVVLPADSPIAELLGPCAEMVAAGPGAPGTAWGLAPLGRQALAPDTTLDAAGIADGAVLYLRPLAPERPEPFVAVSSSFLDDEGAEGDAGPGAGAAGRRPWDGAARALTLSAAAAIYAAGIVPILGAGDRSDAEAAAAALTGAFVLLAAVMLLRFAGAMPEARDPIAIAAGALAAGGGWWTAAPSGSASWGDRLDQAAAAGLALVIAGIVLAVAAPSAAGAGVAVVGGFAAVAAKLGEALGSPAAKTFALVAVGAIGALAVAPSVAAALGRPLRLAATVAEPPPDDPTGEVAAAQGLLTWLVGSLALVLAVSLAVLGASLDEPLAVVVGVCASLALLVQSLRFRFLADGLVLFAAGLVGIGGLEGALAARLARGDDHPVLAVVLAAAVAVVLAVGAATQSRVRA
ncbi:MAG TPA: EsaB/YukD family protein, partial [Candidatus Dormibacteraeota bacterium]|nr:EsaB/YukD family protein [Candidatus Dormibacteraeota bacterium]